MSTQRQMYTASQRQAAVELAQEAGVTAASQQCIDPAGT